LEKKLLIVAGLDVTWQYIVSWAWQELPPSEEQMAFKQTQEAFDASGNAGLVPLLSSSPLLILSSSRGGTEEGSRANLSSRFLNFFFVFSSSSEISANPSVQRVQQGKCVSFSGQEISLGVPTVIKEKRRGENPESEFVSVPYHPIGMVSDCYRNVGITVTWEREPSKFQNFAYVRQGRVTTHLFH
jgi:hypothetical protein